ncbi:uncharacterized protein LACBIDRAFT_308043 [Laccaria bicolor S238N-H82]|uniref:Predicted protein n=1 Tax=Laccaria bicolor (strain S238N-H82 / ATCC MYA-4686) TaxID=486041 RepID=B0DRI1_LACBS|nr:uncharacterized protein LACBIDRAFT_308043 [Laccaria bicolor S238N-H82]EDR02877.1 predicted protein [Laccaria bicolor S238N-H82]|eukprot:XP_001886587.1 predicted protein [Laccaria bicolor S238N-H82]
MHPHTKETQRHLDEFNNQVKAQVSSGVKKGFLRVKSKFSEWTNAGHNMDNNEDNDSDQDEENNEDSDAENNPDNNPDSSADLDEPAN